MDDKLRLEGLQNNFYSLKQNCEASCTNLSDIGSKFEKSIEQNIGE